MPLKVWKCPEPKTAFAPQWMVPFFEDTLTADNITEEIRSLVLTKEPELMETISPRPISGIEDGLTSRWHGFNTFTWTEAPMPRWQQFVRQAYLDYISALKAPRPRCYIQGWANTVRKGERLTAHCHDQMPTSYISGNYCVATKGSSTVYYPPYQYDEPLRSRTCLKIENRPGVLTLFPSGLFHETTSYQDDDVRVTLAFDIHIEDSDALGAEGAQGRHVLFDDPNG